MDSIISIQNRVLQINGLDGIQNLLRSQSVEKIVREHTLSENDDLA